MGTNKEAEQGLRDSWEHADDAPGGYCKVEGISGSVTQGEVFRAITEGKQSILTKGPTRSEPNGGRRKRTGRGFHSSDASWAMRGLGRGRSYR